MKEIIEFPVTPITEETFERQKKMGIIPKNSILPPANSGIQAWNDLSDNQKNHIKKVTGVHIPVVRSISMVN